MDSDTLNLIVAAVVVIIVIYVFIRIAIRTRKHGGSMTATMHAATFEFLDKDKQQAAREVVETKADKKVEEENSEESTG